MNHNRLIFYSKEKLLLLLMAGSILSIALCGLRIYWTSNIRFAFLIWNLFLAWIPLILSQVILKMDQMGTSKTRVIAIFLAWLLFFPNAPYILTDFLHLKQKHNIPLWYDLILILAFAWNGMMLGFISLLDIHTLLYNKYKPILANSVIIIVLFLSGFGIYFGRFLRWNTWDIITSPNLLLIDITDRILHPMSHPRTIGVTLCFSLFLMINYYILFLITSYKKQELDQIIQKRTP